jgi:hypothetical protein
VDVWVSADRKVWCEISTSTLRNAYRIAGQILAACAFSAPIRSASLEQIQFLKRAEPPTTDIEIVGEIAERKALKIYHRDAEMPHPIQADKKRRAILEKLVDAKWTAIMRLAEQVCISSSISGKELVRMIEAPLEGE